MCSCSVFVPVCVSLSQRQRGAAAIHWAVVIPSGMGHSQEALVICDISILYSGSMFVDCTSNDKLIEMENINGVSHCTDLRLEGHSSTSPRRADKGPYHCPHNVALMAFGLPRTSGRCHERGYSSMWLQQHRGQEVVGIDGHGFGSPTPLWMPYGLQEPPPGGEGSVWKQQWRRLGGSIG